MPNQEAVALEAKQTGLIASIRRVLGYAVGRQIVIQVGKVHKTPVFSVPFSVFSKPE
jgi:hypothetical protein